jgi:hypothetical protein
MKRNVLYSSLSTALLHLKNSLLTRAASRRGRRGKSIMKSTITLRRVLKWDSPSRNTIFTAATCLNTLAALLALATTARAQPIYDNFDTGGFNPAASWVLFNNPSYPATYTFPQVDAFGGYAFRMQGDVPLSPSSGDGIGTARAGAVCTNRVYTNFYVAADLSNWQTNAYKNTNFTMVALAGRMTPDANAIASGTNWNAVALYYWINSGTQNNPEGLGTGLIGICWVIKGCLNLNIPMYPDLGGLGPSAVAVWTLEPGRTYRFTFQGVGNYLTGSVYDTQDLTKPLGRVFGDTSLGELPPIFLPAPTNGWSGLFACRCASGNDSVGLTDATWDNFYADVAPPTSVSAPATPHGMIGAPQVVDRTPASWTNFYSPAAGISFTATTLTTTNAINTNAIRLILNGVDVSSSLTMSATSPATNVTATFGLPGSEYSLASNTVYDAHIILQDSFNRTTTNVWTFDTFSDAYLARYPNIECEDYDFQGGGYIPFPVPASGFSTNDNSWHTPAGAPIPLGYTFGINSALNGSLPEAKWGYIGMSGVNAYTNAGSGDYYECDRPWPQVGYPPDPNAIFGGFVGDSVPACEYRTGALGWPDFGNGAFNGDAVGTEEGAVWGLSMVNFTANGGIAQTCYAYDTKRQKYAALNTVGLEQFAPPNDPGTFFGVIGANNTNWWDVEEYNVVMTEGSDWFNYTKDWGTGTNYNVYLRAACALTQHLYLYNGATTNRANQLGTFHCTNALMWNWRYTPLLDTNGNLAVVNLGGTNTLRLEIAPEMPRWQTIEYGLALNYLAFVPYVSGSLQVTISPAGAVTAGAQWQVDGGSMQNSGATVTNLPPGLHTVNYSTVTGWTTPASQLVTVTGNQTLSTNGTYVAGIGSLTVTIDPQGARDAGALWQVDTGGWNNSGDTVSDLIAGSHTVNYSTVTGWTAPASQLVTVTGGQTTTTNGTYVATGSLTVTIDPQGARDAGALWQVDSGGWNNSGATVSDLTAGSHTVNYSAVTHWTTPMSANVTIAAGQTTTTNGTYVAVPLTLYSTAQLKRKGSVDWAQETGATVDYTLQKVTVGTNGTRYYQMRWDTKTKIIRVQRQNPNLILTYEVVP